MVKPLGITTFCRRSGLSLWLRRRLGKHARSIAQFIRSAQRDLISRVKIPKDLHKVSSLVLNRGTTLHIYPFGNAVSNAYNKYPLRRDSDSGWWH